MQGCAAPLVPALAAGCSGGGGCSADGNDAMGMVAAPSTTTSTCSGTKPAPTACGVSGGEASGAARGVSGGEAPGNGVSALRGPAASPRSPLLLLALRRPRRGVHPPPCSRLPPPPLPRPGRPGYSACKVGSAGPAPATGRCRTRGRSACTAWP